MWGGGKRGTLDREVLIQEVIRAVNAHDSLYSLHGQSGVDRLASIEQQRGRKKATESVERRRLS